MICYLNGTFLPVEHASIPVQDRGLLYGDGFFESIRVHNKAPFRWSEHWNRMERASRGLRIALPGDAARFGRVLTELCLKNNLRDGVIRITISRGPGTRGYSPKGATQTTVCLTAHPSRLETTGKSEPITVVTARSIQLTPPNLLSGFKHANRLIQVLARMEADDQNADEALLLDYSGNVAESSGANVFWFHNDTLCTPPLETNALPGVTRALVREMAADLKWSVTEQLVPPEHLYHAEGLFLANSSLGIVEVGSLDGHPIPMSPLVAALRTAYQARLDAECGSGT